MDALNPIRSVQGRGDPCLRANMVSYLSNHPDGVDVHEVAAHTGAAPRTVKRILDEAVKAGLLDDDYAVKRPNDLAGIAHGVRHKYAQFISDEMGLSELDAQAAAENAIISTGWVNRFPDEYHTVELDGSPKAAATLVKELAGNDDVDIGI